MASRPKGYGLTAEVKEKLAAKYEDDKEQEARLWIEAVIKEPLDKMVGPHERLGPKRFHAALKDGTKLCKLVNIIMAPKKVKYNESNLPFKQMENINLFLQACENYGIAKTDLFQTVDLFESQNLWQVILAIYALGRKAQKKGYHGPTLGPKEAEKNQRDFSEEQLNAGQTVIGLQMGTNKGASQKGMSFGTTRHIADLQVEEPSKEGQAVIGLQMGSNQGANQSGINFGKSRGIMGTNK